MLTMESLRGPGNGEKLIVATPSGQNKQELAL